MKKFLLAAAAFGLMTTTALAGPAGDKAKAHIDAIAKGDVAAIAATYADSTTLNWVGGPLDGTYVGADKLKDVWGKFTTAQGPLKATVTNVQESGNPKGDTVTANVVFAGKTTIKVRYIMMYRDGKLVNEIWQIDPSATY